MNISMTAPVTTRSRSRWLALVVLCVSLLVIVIDNTIVNVTLPTLVSDLNADLSELQWVVDAYTLVFAGLFYAPMSFMVSGLGGRPDHDLVDVGLGGCRSRQRWHPALSPFPHAA